MSCFIVDTQFSAYSIRLKSETEIAFKCSPLIEEVHPKNKYCTTPCKFKLRIQEIISKGRLSHIPQNEKKEY